MRAPFLFLALSATSPAFAAEPAWPQFRGPGGLATADTATLPVTWSATKNVAWVVEVPGQGWSSPVVAAERVFLTSARGGIKPAQTGIFGNDYVAELKKQGLPDDEVNRRVIARDIEQTREIEEVSYLGPRLRHPHGKTALGTRGPPRQTFWRPAPQEHLRLRDSRDRWRAPLRLVRRKRRPFLSFA